MSFILNLIIYPSASDDNSLPKVPPRKLSHKGRSTFPRLATRRKTETMDVFKFDPILTAMTQPPKAKKVWCLSTDENPAGVKNAIKNPSDVVWLDDTYFAVSLLVIALLLTCLFIYQVKSSHDKVRIELTS